MTESGSHKPVLVVGGGVAGLIAALDLAALGREVELVDSAPRLGGQVAKLDKIYPGDHCAFCPLWTEIKRVEENENIRIYLTSNVTTINPEPEGYTVTITGEPGWIDESLCVFCGRCRDICPEQAIRPLWEHASPPSFFIDKTQCTQCGTCPAVCPTDAIDTRRPSVYVVLSVADIVWATGFREADLTPLAEFGYGSHRDIMTSLEFEKWTAESGPNQGRILRRSDKQPPRSIAFIQCAGARDLRLLPYCSGVCCMHALKQAQWVKRRSPEIDCTIFYTDLRTIGRDYYDYGLKSLHMATGVNLVRARPGFIRPMPDGSALALNYEDTEAQKIRLERFDLVVLNGNLRPSLVPSSPGAPAPVALDGDGFVDRAGDDVSRFACGFSREPADIAEAVLHASSSVMQCVTREKGRG
ncbi:MAG: 4Fe-4S binding protein [Syntrophales bacterium]|jgi:heterodisulfide reductase subunit A-like polyferredoxin|nr:4Fe-4S binding protein [Syntrophales bacterium]MCK9528550.1 4Fe-4S binding protein [Syntrophales bacterium]MDX9922823.1 4Fe-4S binding protein [Syntrophales bacterium]